ncbi:MAG TPA: peptidase U32 family protein [Bacteroidales bacterium]|nr:peptidase U32 family protein [Bacteroidales bacterium]HOK99533.1 peptidase U32 family protein [Bacteroidales bacterium]HPO65058.1 peptidase U32 family protein [Bacteroidales bacterium]
MNLLREDIELLAPVGSYESLQAAFHAHADAVYLGVGKLNMRSLSSGNFSETDLLKISDQCRKHHVKCYVTLNAVMYDDDLDEVEKILAACKEAGVDAVIASDIAVMQKARELGLNVHLSTQVNISNTESLKFFSRYADAVVLARELNLQQVKRIYENITSQNITGPQGKPIRLEMFVHGALCMAISGKCYLSLHQYNHSANRGECFQVCRRSYIVTDKETQSQLEIDNEYIMSPKDLCTIEFLDKILFAGARLLKIEGRARGPEYVKIVTLSYHKAIDAILEGKFTDSLKKELLSELSKVYNRGFWDGYYLGRKLGEWSNSYGSIATKKKIYVGKVINYYSKAKVVEVSIETGSIAQGDTLLFIGPTTGVEELTVNELQVNDIPSRQAEKGQHCTIPSTIQLRRSDKVYKWVDNADL